MGVVGRTHRRRADTARPSNRGGHALVSVLLMLAALTTLGAFAAMHARLDVLVQHHVGCATTAFAVAESGLEHARAELRLDPDFDRLLSGPDRLRDTNDDGEFPFLGPRSLPIEPGYAYDLRVDPLSATMIDLISTATGPERSMHVLALTVVRDRAQLPAAVTTTAPGTTLDLGSSFRLSGSDQAGRDPALPGLAVADRSVATVLRAQISADAADRITGAGGTPSIAASAAPSIEDMAAGFAARRTRDVGPYLDGAVGTGVAVSTGSLEIAATAGDGVLVVDGNLRVTGELIFSGVVIVQGDVLFDTGSLVRIQGGLLQGRGNGGLAFLGDGAIGYDSGVIERIDTDFPDLLPHRARVAGWRDLS